MEDLDASEDLLYQEHLVKISETSESYPNHEDQDVQGAMESPYRE
jgi:hypothetical protein